MTPNDPKLSDGGGWCAGCMVGERRRQEAASVTAGAVRCSAWLGVAVIRERRWVRTLWESTASQSVRRNSERYSPKSRKGE